MARRIIAAVFFIASVAYAGNYGGGPNAFAQLSLTPRETSMGGSGSVFAEGVFASYWNPAGVLKGDTTQFTAAFISRRNASLFTRRDVRKRGQPTSYLRCKYGIKI